MFYNCSSLVSLPDISKWNISKNIKTDEVFYNSYSLNNLSIINQDSKDIISSLKISSESNNNNSETFFSDKNESDNNNNKYFNYGYFDGLNEDNQYYYEKFYSKY